MPRQTEPSLNNAMGTLLGAMLPRSDVRSENTQAIYGHPGLRPDILITAPGRAPVVIEAEYMPAAGVEAEARDRLGLETAAAGREIEAAVALRYPDEVGEVQDLSAALSGARLSYCVFTENRGAARFPESGWLDGSVEDLADMVRLVSVPQHAVDRATAILQEGIDGAASILDELDRTRPGITEAVANLLGMANVRQTRRMACAIIANALVFHDQIAGMHARINSLALACGDTVDNPQGEVLAAWTAILNINYWPIFAIAKDILEHLDSADAARILRRLRDTAQAVNATGVENAHDLTGRIFQRLIADRKYLATFYTLPASAALLARLAVARLKGVDWRCADAIGNLRVGDFACGTGALLSAVYEQVAARHEREGGSLDALHPVMMEEVLYGCDVMPAAIHITSSTLSGAQPNVRYGHSRLYVMPYGRQKDSYIQAGAGASDVKIGSLELLESSRQMVLINTTDYHGNAGIASAFTALADRKLKPGGVLALVLPLSVASGLSWQQVRELLATDYTDLTVLSLAANGRGMSFSSDTGMAECLVVARKRRPEEVRARRATFVSLRRRPQGFAHASAVAKSIAGSGAVRQIEDGPYDGTPLMIGDGPGGRVGTLLTVPNDGSGANWGAVRLLDYSLAQTAHALSDSRLWLPGQAAALELKTAPLGEVGQLGLVDRDITGPPPRGPFTKTTPSPTATYPALWNHSAANETRMVCVPDSQLLVRQGMEARAAEVWATASRVHINRDFRFNSQPLTAAITEQKSVGGRAWPNVAFTDARFDCLFALWCNSTLGLLSYWWHANKQQPGRGITTIRAAESLPVLDFRALSDTQFQAAYAIFDEFRELDLKPAYLADIDANRALLDRRVVCDLLGFDTATRDAVRRLAAKWCAEPSVHGGKRRPANAG
jgi:hypothetical protein